MKERRDVQKDLDSHTPLKTSLRLSLPDTMPQPPGSLPGSHMTPIGSSLRSSAPLKTILTEQDVVRFSLTLP